MSVKSYLLFIVFALSLSNLNAQNVQSAPVDFIIKRIKNTPNQNKMRMLLNFEVTEGSNQFTGIGVLSMCGCYCDSIWDAWPVEVLGNGIPGTGTLHFVNGGGSQSPLPPGTPQNAVLGIRMVEGGITRNTDFDVWLKYIETDD